MAYNFPDNPTNGQIFSPANGPIWQWDGLVWKSRKEAPTSGVFLSGHGFGGLGKAGEGPSAIQEATIGDVLPAIGDWNGQLWWESDTGKFYIWFDDGSSSQWVQIIAPVVITDVSGATVVATGGVVPRTLADWFAGLGRQEEPAKLGFWTDQGPVNIWRMKDRIFVGAAGKYDGRLLHAQGSWLGNPQVSAGDGNASQHWLESSAQFFTGHSEGGVAILGSSRSSDRPTLEGQTTIGLAGYAYGNVGALGSSPVRAGFLEAVRGNNALSQVLGLDINVKNVGDNLSAGSYSLGVPGSTYGLRILAGGDPSLEPVATNNSSAALVIGANAKRWNSGIIFDAQGLDGTDYAGNGKAVAVSLARGHALQWRHGNTLPSAEIRSDNFDVNAETRVVFDDQGLTIRCLDTTLTRELVIAQFPFNGGASVYPVLASGAANVSIRAEGLSIDSDIKLVPKGIGHVVAPSSIVAANASDVEPGGSPGMGLLFSTVPNFGVFFGSDQPTIPAAPGSLYLRSDGTINGRVYVNVGSGWIGLVDDNSDKVGLEHIGSGGDAHAVVIATGDVTYPAGLAGFMAAADKQRLDAIKDVTAGGISGLMTGTDKTKLDGLVPVLPDGVPGLMIGVDKTKLDSIAPVIPAGIPGLISGEDKAKLDGMTGVSGIPDVTPGGPSGLMTGSDKSRLDSFTDTVPNGISGLMSGTDKFRLDNFVDVTPNGPSGLMKGTDKTKLDSITDVIANGPSGLMLGSDKARLDSFDNVTPGGDPGFMLGTDKQKLDSIAPVTPGGIPGLMLGDDKTKIDGYPATLGNAVPNGTAGLMTGSDKYKLDSILPVVAGGVDGLISGADKTKLNAMTVGTGTYIDRMYTTIGVQSWIKPAGIIALEVWVQAGGGGGGGATAIAAESAMGSGGGGGGYGFQSYDAAAIALMPSSVSLTVGNGGTGGAASNGVGGVGGNSSFGTLVCNGGLGGQVLGSGTTMAIANGGAGGTTQAGAQVPIRGSSGQFAVRIGTPASAGGGAGGAAGGGSGGAPPTGVAGTAGTAGESGSGGSGAFSSNATGGAAGGAGGVGYIKVREHY